MDNNHHSPEDLAFEMISKGGTPDEVCKMLNTLAKTMERIQDVQEHNNNNK